jgi:hypothetical protein
MNWEKVKISANSCLKRSGSDGLGVSSPVVDIERLANRDNRFLHVAGADLDCSPVGRKGRRERMARDDVEEADRGNPLGVPSVAGLLHQ